MDKMKGEKGGTHFYKNNEEFKDCIDSLRAIRFMPSAKIEKQMKIIMGDAYDKLNNGIRGSGKAGSAMAVFHNVWVSFWNENLCKLSDEFNMAAALSVYDRMDGPSNQNMEGANRDMNDTHEIAASGGKKTIFTWVEGCRLMEKQFKDRLSELEKGESPKKKNKNLRKRDRSFLTARNKHKRRKYSSNEDKNDQLFFDRCKENMKLSRESY